MSEIKDEANAGMLAPSIFDSLSSAKAGISSPPSLDESFCLLVNARRIR